MHLLQHELPDLGQEIIAADGVLVAGFGGFRFPHPGQFEYAEWIGWLADHLGGESLMMVRPDSRLNIAKGSSVYDEDQRLYMVERMRGVWGAFIGEPAPDGAKTSIHAMRQLGLGARLIIAIGQGWSSERSRWHQELPDARIVVAPFPHRDSSTQVLRRIVATHIDLA